MLRKRYLAYPRRVSLVIGWIALWGLLVGNHCPSHTPYGIEGPFRNVDGIFPYKLAHEAGFRWTSFFIPWWRLDLMVGGERCFCWNQTSCEDPASPTGYKDCRFAPLPSCPDPDGDPSDCPACCDADGDPSDCPACCSSCGGPTPPCARCSTGMPLQTMDEHVQQAAGAGMAILAIIEGTPPWANGGNGTMVPPNAVPGGNPADEHFYDFAYAVAQRYGPSSTIGLIKAYELYSEINFTAHWSDQSAAGQQAYRNRILKPGFDAIKAAYPQAWVAGAPIYFGHLESSGSFIKPWLKENVCAAACSNAGAPCTPGGGMCSGCGDACGALARPVDFVSIHSYRANVGAPGTANTVLNDVDLVVNQIFQTDPAFANVGRFWLTEFGWGRPSGPNCPSCSSETDCANKILAVFAAMDDTVAGGGPKYPKWERSFLFSYHDRTQARWELECHYGLIDDNDSLGVTDGMPEVGVLKQRYNLVKCGLTGMGCGP